MWVCGRTEKARYLFVILKISRNLGWSWPYQQDNDSTTEFANMLVTSPLRTDCKNMQYRQWDHDLVCITSCQNTGSQWIWLVNNGPLLKCWSYSHCYKEACSKVYITLWCSLKVTRNITNFWRFSPQPPNKPPTVLQRSCYQPGMAVKPSCATKGFTMWIYILDTSCCKYLVRRC